MARANPLLLVALAGASCASASLIERDDPAQRTLIDDLVDGVPNNLPMPNPAGAAASHSTEGAVDLDDDFHAPQGENGRTCATCHAVEAGWSITPAQVELMFALTGGTHPIFNPLDADNPAEDVSTVEARRRAYSMLLRGLFRRGGPLPAGADFEVVAAADPYGVATTKRLSYFRRPLTTANLRLNTGVMWDDRLTVTSPAGRVDLRASLVKQARGIIMGAEEGAAPSDEIVSTIVDEELMISHAQVTRHGVRLDGCGGRGGPEPLARQPLVAGRFSLFDAWIGLRPGACSTKKADEERARIARGQELFNERRNATGDHRCAACHNAANNGTNVGGLLFDIK